MIKYVNYSDKGKAVSDFELNDEYQKLISSNKEYFSYSTENIFHRIRLGILKNEISFKEFIFIYDERYIFIDEYAKMINWPKGFIEQNSKLNEMILLEMMNMIEAAWEIVENIEDENRPNKDFSKNIEEKFKNV